MSICNNICAILLAPTTRAVKAHECKSREADKQNLNNTMKKIERESQDYYNGK